MIPLLPFYAERMGASPSQVGLLLTSYSACQLFAGPLLGQLSDRFGRKPILLISQVGTFLGFLILGAAETLPLVFLSRIIDGTTAGNLSVAQAYIADVTAPAERSRAFGLIGIAFGLGFLVGPAISGFLSQFGYHWPVYAAAGLSATSILATLFLLPRTEPVAGVESGRRLTLLSWGRYREYFRRPRFAPLLWQFFAFVLSFSIFTSGFALYAERRFTWNGQPFGPEEVGYFYGYAGLLGLFTQGPALGRLVKRFGEVALLLTGFAALVAGYAGLALAFTVPALVAVTTISALGGFVRPVATSLITQAAQRSEQGLVLGLTQSLTSVAQIVGPLIAGYLIEHGMLGAWGFTASVIAGVGLVFAAGIRRFVTHDTSKR